MCAVVGTDCDCVHICRWLRQLFDSADVNGDGSLSLKEISKMFHELNINSSHKNVKKKFQVKLLNDKNHRLILC